jgi:hypothetical protein
MASETNLAEPVDFDHDKNHVDDDASTLCSVRTDLTTVVATNVSVRVYEF